MDCGASAARAQTRTGRLAKVLPEGIHWLHWSELAAMWSRDYGCPLPEVEAQMQEIWEEAASRQPSTAHRFPGWGPVDGPLPYIKQLEATMEAGWEKEPLRARFLLKQGVYQLEDGHHRAVITLRRRLLAVPVRIRHWNEFVDLTSLQ